jgi:pimeloyl-ACP methyl ester carboxylesterase
MTRPDVQVTNPSGTRERLDRPTVAETLRKRLLAGAPVTERRLRLAGVSTAVLEGGDGPPIVLLHGPVEYGPSWFSVFPDLVTTHRVIAPDLPGHGASEVMEGPPELDRMVAWIDDLIECTCSKPPVLVGHVFGGAIAARFASVRNERLESLVLVDSLGLAPFQPAPEFGRALTAYLMNPTEATHDDLWSVCAFNLDGARAQMGDRWEHIRAYNLDRARVPALGAALHALMERYGMPAIPPAELARITVPTSLIWGRHDLATPLAVAQDASARYGWPLRVVENAAADPPLEQPEAFVQALRATLEAR